MFCKTFATSSSTNIKISKDQLNKKVQSVWFLGRLLGPLSRTCL